MIKRCHQAHRLVIEAMDRKLPPITRFRLHLHLLACDACTNFKREMLLLRRAMQSLDLY
jgi:hypothetical protein